MHSGTALGILSLAIQCLQAFQLFLDAAKYPETSPELLQRLDIERYKFKVWSRAWSIPAENVQFESQIQELDASWKEEINDVTSLQLLLCAKSLQIIFDLLTKSDTLKPTYGFQLEIQQDSPSATSRKENPPLLRRKTLEGWKRITWTVSDQTVFKVSLRICICPTRISIWFFLPLSIGTI